MGKNLMLSTTAKWHSIKFLMESRKKNPKSSIVDVHVFFPKKFRLLDQFLNLLDLFVKFPEVPNMV